MLELAFEQLLFPIQIYLHRKYCKSLWASLYHYFLHFYKATQNHLIEIFSLLSERWISDAIRRCCQTSAVYQAGKQFLSAFNSTQKWTCNEMMPDFPEWKSEHAKICCVQLFWENDELSWKTGVVNVFHFSCFTRAWYVLHSKNILTWRLSCYLDPCTRQVLEKKWGRRKRNAISLRTKYFRDALGNAAKSRMSGKMI